MSKIAPICFTCKVEMRAVDNGFIVKDKATGTFPATFWRGDVFSCLKCGAMIITNFGAAHDGSNYQEEERNAALEFYYE